MAESWGGKNKKKGSHSRVASHASHLNSQGLITARNRVTLQAGLAEAINRGFNEVERLVQKLL